MVEEAIVVVRVLEGEDFVVDEGVDFLNVRLEIRRVARSSLRLPW